MEVLIKLQQKFQSKKAEGIGSSNQQTKFPLPRVRSFIHYDFVFYDSLFKKIKVPAEPSLLIKSTVTCGYGAGM